MHKSILVPIDIAHLAEGKAAVDIALSNATDGCKIVLLNVIEDLPKWARAQLVSGTIEKSEQHARDELGAIAKAYDAKMNVEIRMGHTYQIILDVAAEIGADLIVIASHRPGFKDYYLGSAAAKVVRHAKCSVHVIR